MLNEVSRLLSGGAYLFDTWANTLDYGNWTSDVYEVGVNQRPSQPLFQDAVRTIWLVIGACNFDPVEDHAVGRFQRWSYRHDARDVGYILRDVYPAIRDSPREQGPSASLLLHRPDEKGIAIQFAFRMAEAIDSSDDAHESLRRVERQVSLKVISR
ncbi:hypothetical protein BDV29DRAFT_159342 [Aspergillus leporis]|uniref:Uncharacterized protein n=1 Tax=Aspergillus leporis TaxID=41062 RepID=A0A5N5WUT6_9EURO|nr:hypothetical protein BDV29DRAFT_159342 [Aspergillus leporis]